MTLVSCSKIVLIHEIDNPEPSLSFNPHKGIINSSVWNHNTDFVIGTCGHDGKIYLTLTKSPKVSNSYPLEDPEPSNSPINTISFTSTSMLLASGGSDNLVKVWDLKSKSLHSKYKAHFGAITSVDWHSNDNILASSSIVGDIVLHNIANTNGLPIANFNQKSSNGIKMIKFSPFVKEYLASGGNDGTVSIWDINKRMYTSTFSLAHSSRVNSLAFSPQNQLLLSSVSLDQNINFYDINQKKIVKTIPSDEPLTSLGFNYDGYTIVVGTLYGKVLIYDLRNPGGQLKNLKGHEANCVNFIDFKKGKDKSDISGFGENLEKENILKKKELNSQNSSLMMNSSELIKLKKENSKDSIKDLTYSPISKSQQEIRSNYDELKTKLSNLEEMKKDSFHKIEPKPNLLERKISEHIKAPSGTDKNSLFLKKDSNLTQNTSPIINKSPDVLKGNSKDSMEIPINKNKENDLIAEKSKYKYSLDELHKKTQERIAESDGFSEKQKDFLNALFKEQHKEMRSYFQDSLQDMHLEIIRQFQIQQMEITGTIEKYMLQNQELHKKILELELENNNLKKISY